MISNTKIKVQATQRALITLVLLSALPSMSHSETVEQHAWSDRVFEKAKAENKLVLLDLAAEWCQFCKKMEKTTYRDDSVTATLNKNYIVVKADEADYPELADKYKNDGRPTTVIFNQDGTQIMKRVGYIKPQWMVWMLQAVAENPTPKPHQL